MAEASKDVVQRLTLVCRHAGRPTVVDDRGNTCACCDAAEEIERLGMTLREAHAAIWAMAEDGWLVHGSEGMAEPQQLVYDYMRKHSKEVFV
jgi:hypothetical protein